MAGNPSTARRAVLLAVAGLLVAGLAAPSALAYHTQVAETAVASSITDTVIIPLNNYTVYTFSLWIGETITYDIRAANDSLVDVYIVPPDGLDDYRSDLSAQFRLYERLENQAAFRGTFTLASGDVSIVIDNTDFVPGGAIPFGAVTVAVDLHKNPSLVYLGAVGLILFGVALLAAVAVLARRRARRPAKPSPPPPPRPYQKKPTTEVEEEPAGPPAEPPTGPLRIPEEERVR